MKKNSENYYSLESSWEHGASISKDIILSTSPAKSHCTPNLQGELPHFTQILVF